MNGPVLVCAVSVFCGLLFSHFPAEAQSGRVCIEAIRAENLTRLSSAINEVDPTARYMSCCRAAHFYLNGIAQEADYWREQCIAAVRGDVEEADANDAETQLRRAFADWSNRFDHVGYIVTPFGALGTEFVGEDPQDVSSHDMLLYALENDHITVKELISLYMQMSERTDEQVGVEILMPDSAGEISNEQMDEWIRQIQQMNELLSQEKSFKTRMAH